jgi:hypothetical protein
LNLIYESKWKIYFFNVDLYMLGKKTETILRFNRIEN